MTLTIWMPLVELLDSTYLGYKKHVLNFHQKKNISPVSLLDMNIFSFEKRKCGAYQTNLLQYEVGEGYLGQHNIP